MVEKLRARPGASGLISSVGWYLTKHAVGIYSSAPPAAARLRESPAAYQPIIDAEAAPPLAHQANGLGTVETYTVQHDRDGNPTLAVIVARLEDGSRCWANNTDTAVLEDMERAEFIGRRGQLRYHEPTQVNLFEP
jgi:acetyl-CoA C-acetyltransferase